MPPDLVDAARTRFRLTAAGRVALPVALLALLVGLFLGGTAALVGATALALFALSPLLAWLSIRGLRIAPPAARAAFAKEDFLLELEGANASRVFRVRDLVLHQESDPRRAARPAGYACALAPGEHASLRFAARLAARGRHRTLPVGASTTHPFGLVRCIRSYELAADLLALPQLGHVAPLARELARSSDRPAELPTPRRGEEELYGVREWRPGESPRRMHWKLSARRGRGIVREMRASAEPPLFLALVTAIELSTNPIGRRRAFETAVSLVASLAERELRSGARLLLALGDEAPPIELGGRRASMRALALLAEVEAREGDALEAASKLLGRAHAAGLPAAVVYAGRRALRRGVDSRSVAIDVDEPGLELVFRRVRGVGELAPSTELAG